MTGGGTPRLSHRLIIGLVGALASIAALWFLVELPPIVAIGIGLVMGVGAALLFAPVPPKPLDLSGPPPAGVDATLERVLASADETERAVARLRGRALWTSSSLDEQVLALVGGIRALATTPAMAARSALDGDVDMLYRLATDYLPAIVNLATEQDRMHSTFSGRTSREQVERNVRGLEEQVAILAEALDRIETDVVRGSTQSVHEHAAFLELRFERLDGDAVLDLSRLRPPPESA